MNREIKFRAWDTENKSMERVAIFLIDEYKTYPHDRGYIHNCQDWEHHDLISKPVIMQYTGLKDKNGKEIYEGDIVEFKTNYTNKKGGWLNGVVIWDSERYGWALNAENTIYDIYDETEGFEYIVKHIGNIYENPELLTNN